MEIEERKPSAASFVTVNTAVLIATILASSMAFIDSTALNVALPAIQEDFNASGVQLLWVVNAYLLMLSSLILVGGSLGDKLGRKKVYVTGILIFLGSSLLCGLSPSIEWLIGARLLQGVGGALMIPGSLAIINSCYEKEKRGEAIGIWSAATTMIFVTGPVLGGILTDLGFWRGVFLINLPLGAVALFFLFARVPESRDETMTGPIDYLGAVLITLGLAGITFGTLSAPDRGFTDPLVAASLVLGVSALAAFVPVERRSAHPMLPLHLFRSRPFSGSNLVTLFVYGGLSILTLFLNLNMIQVQGYSKTQAGLAILPFAAMLILLSRWSGGVADRGGPRLLLVVGPVIVGVGALYLTTPGITSGPAEYWTTFFPGMLLFGIGMGLVVAPLTSTVMGSVAEHYSGTASGVNNAVSRTAGVLAIAIVGALALAYFSSLLAGSAAALGLEPAARQAVIEQAPYLGDARVPPEVPAAAAAEVEQAFDRAFVATFRMTMLVSAGLAFAGALAAWFLVPIGPLAEVDPGRTGPPETRD